LNILAGRASSNGAIDITADLRLNNYTVDPTNIETRKNIAFVAQDDSLQETSTPRECIYFSAKLRLPKSTSEEHLRKLTERMLEELGLVDCADTIVGGPLLKGISGGQRKRTSVGVELVTVSTVDARMHCKLSIQSHGSLSTAAVISQSENSVLL
jgi:ABC-type multidrug transport system ATPase subunit